VSVHIVECADCGRAFDSNAEGYAMDTARGAIRLCAQCFAQRFAQRNHETALRAGQSDSHTRGHKTAAEEE
jgi:hypothetical protein